MAPSRTMNGFMTAALPSAWITSSKRLAMLGRLMRSTAYSRLTASVVIDHVGHALSVVEVIIRIPHAHGTAVGFAILEQLGMGVAEQVAPALEKPDQLDVAALQRLRCRRGLLQAGPILA